MVCWVTCKIWNFFHTFSKYSVYVTSGDTNNKSRKVYCCQYSPPLAQKSFPYGAFPPSNVKEGSSFVWEVVLKWSGSNINSLNNGWGERDACCDRRWFMLPSNERRALTMRWRTLRAPKHLPESKTTLCNNIISAKAITDHSTARVNLKACGPNLAIVHILSGPRWYLIFFLFSFCSLKKNNFI